MGRGGGAEWKAWLCNFWPTMCLIQAADLKKQLQFIANVQRDVFLCCLPLLAPQIKKK